MELVLNVQELLQECSLLPFPHFVHFHKNGIEFLVQDENLKLVLGANVIDLHFNFLSSHPHVCFVLFLLKFTHCLLYTFRLSVAINLLLVAVFN